MSLGIYNLVMIEIPINNCVLFGVEERLVQD